MIRNMVYKNATIVGARLPEPVMRVLDAEAQSLYRSRNEMILMILLERYKLTLNDISEGETRASPPPSKKKAKTKAKSKATA